MHRPPRTHHRPHRFANSQQIVSNPFAVCPTRYQSVPAARLHHSRPIWAATASDLVASHAAHRLYKVPDTAIVQTGSPTGKGCGSFRSLARVEPTAERLLPAHQKLQEFGYLRMLWFVPGPRQRIQAMYVLNRRGTGWFKQQGPLAVFALQRQNALTELAF